MRATVIRVLAERGLSGNDGEFHSSRCVYPEIYGQCTCVADFTEDMILALTA